MSVNKVILVGNVGKDPDVRYIDTNVPVATFPIATSETYRSKEGDKVTNTEWHNIVLWRGLAEVAEKYVKKGSQLYIEGKIRTRSYTDKENVKRYVTEIVADTMQMLGKRSDNESSDSSRDNTPSQQYGSNQTPSQGKSSSGNQGGTFDDTSGPNDQADDLPF